MVTIRFFKAHGFWKKNVLVSFSQSLNRTYNVHSPTTLFPFLYHTPVSLFSLSLFIWSLFLFTFKISISLPSLFLFLVVTRHLDLKNKNHVTFINVFFLDCLQQNFLFNFFLWLYNLNISFGFKSFTLMKVITSNLHCINVHIL